MHTLDFGGVLVNEVPTWRADQMPYGGIRDSGNTREGPAYSVREMTETRLVSSRRRADSPPVSVSQLDGARSRAEHRLQRPQHGRAGRLVDPLDDGRPRRGMPRASWAQAGSRSDAARTSTS